MECYNFKYYAVMKNYKILKIGRIEIIMKINSNFAILEKWKRFSRFNDAYTVTEVLNVKKGNVFYWIFNKYSNILERKYNK